MLTSLSDSTCDQTAMVLLMVAMTEVSATVKMFREEKKFSLVPGYVVTVMQVERMYEELLSCERMSIQEWMSMSRAAVSVGLLLLLVLLHLGWAKTLHLSRVKTSLHPVNKG